MAPVAPSTRRAVLAGTGALGLGALIGMPEGRAAGPDAHMLGLCAAFEDENRRQSWLNVAPDPSDEELTACVDRWHGLVDEITACPAHSADAVKAKAATLRAVIYDNVVVDRQETLKEASWIERLAWSLVNDMVGTAA